jgi:hypothetical protein
VKNMQVRVTIELQGEPDEIGTTLAGIGTVLPQEQAAEPPTEGTVWWTSERADELVRQITDNARRALKVICENAPQVPFDAVLDALGMDGVSTGGVMASVGFAIRNMEAPAPLARNYGRRLYLIDSQVAEVLAGALERYGE